MKTWNWSMRLIFGLMVGGAIAYVDNVAFAGEVSPIVIVLLLLAAASMVAVVWGARGWIAVGQCGCECHWFISSSTFSAGRTS